MVNYNMGIINRSLLASGITGASSTLQVSAGDGAKFEAPPFLLVLTADLSQASLDIAEFVEIIDVSTDIFTFGERDLYGQADTQIHAAGTVVAEVWQPLHITSLQQNTLNLEYALAHVIGQIGTGVKVWGPDYDQQLTVEQDTPDMTVKIQAGFGFRDFVMGRLIDDFTTDTIVAPTTDPRKDLVSMDTIFNKIVVTTGVEGGGISSTPANNFALAEIDLIVSQSTIVNGDITDVRIQL